MRSLNIAHIVTYVSPDGAFGGPVRVAMGHAAALAERGHSVTVYAAAPVRHTTAVLQDGYTLRLFPARKLPGLGFAGMSGQGLSHALTLEAPRIDVAHVHLARDLVTLPAVRRLRRAGVPYVVQPHGMIDKSSHLLAGPIDSWETKAALRGASSVLVLTRQEESALSDLLGGLRIEQISNGINASEFPADSPRDIDVLFLARLHPRKRPRAFVEMAVILGRDFPDACFVIAGADEGAGRETQQAIDAAGMGERLRWIGAVAPDQTDALLARSKVFVLPSVGEVFPMTLLEAFRAGTPSVVTHSLGVADDAAQYGAIRVTDGTPRQLADAVSELLSDASAVEATRRGGYAFLRDRLDIGAVVDVLERSYREAIPGGNSRSLSGEPTTDRDDLPGERLD